MTDSVLMMRGVFPGGISVGIPRNVGSGGPSLLGVNISGGVRCRNLHLVHSSEGEKDSVLNFDKDKEKEKEKKKKHLHEIKISTEDLRRLTGWGIIEDEMPNKSLEPPLDLDAFLKKIEVKYGLRQKEYVRRRWIEIEEVMEKQMEKEKENVVKNGLRLKELVRRRWMEMEMEKEMEINDST